MSKSFLEESTVTKRFLFPRRKHIENPFFIKTKIGKLSCYRHLKDINKSMLIVFHGSNEIVNDYIEVFAKEIDKIGYNLLIVEYRGFSYSSGFASLTNILDDISYIIENCGVAEDKIIAFGRSLGTVYAMHAIKLFPKIKGIIIESGFSDFYERINKRLNAEDIDVTEKELKNEVYKYFNVKETIQNFKGASLFMHSIDNRTINVAEAKKMHNWANNPKTLSLYSEGGHTDFQEINKEKYFNDIKIFMDKNG